jgi:hypothetical protein
MHKKKKGLVIILPYNKINTLIWAILSFKQKKIQNQYMGTQKIWSGFWGTFFF